MKRRSTCGILRKFELTLNIVKGLLLGTIDSVFILSFHGVEKPVTTKGMEVSGEYFSFDKNSK